MGYVMRAQVASIAEEKMQETMPKYNNSKEIQIVWDNLQQQVTRNYIYDYYIIYNFFVVFIRALYPWNNGVVLFVSPSFLTALFC